MQVIDAALFEAARALHAAMTACLDNDTSRARYRYADGTLAHAPWMARIVACIRSPQRVGHHVARRLFERCTDATRAEIDAAIEDSEAESRAYHRAQDARAQRRSVGRRRGNARCDELDAALAVRAGLERVLSLPEAHVRATHRAVHRALAGKEQTVCKWCKDGEQ